MKNKKGFFLTVLSLLAISSLVACGGGNSNKNDSSSIDDEPEPNLPLEIGDTVKEWTSARNLNESPMGLSVNGGDIDIEKDFGQEDNESLYVTAHAGSDGQGYIGSDLIANPYFLEGDAKNGDIISLYLYVPSDSNVASLQLQVLPISMNNPISGDLIEIKEEDENKWFRTVISYDTLETLGAIRVVYKPLDKNNDVYFYVDDINITLGEKTVKTEYEYNDESLFTAYEKYFKIGACMSSNMLKNTELREIACNDFNSLTAENEGKPEQVLDQQAMQAGVKSDDACVVITTKPFEKLYDFCEAKHIGVRHHTFVWYSQTPGWFFTKDYTNNGAKVDRDTMLRRMENFIRTSLETINDRWPGLVYAIDVSNEAIENGGYRTNNNNWYSVVGKDYVYNAFKFASMYKDEEQKLYYNDFSFDYNTSHCEFALNTLLKEAIEEELIDGVGIQGHIDSNANLDNIMTDAKMIYEKGLECQVTELDITVNGTDDANLKKQKEAYKTLLTKMLTANMNEETNITAMVVWGINDDASWKSSQNPLLFTRNFKKKPAYYGVLEAAQEFAEEYPDYAAIEIEE